VDPVVRGWRQRCGGPATTARAPGPTIDPPIRPLQIVDSSLPFSHRHCPCLADARSRGNDLQNEMSNTIEGQLADRSFYRRSRIDPLWDRSALGGSAVVRLRRSESSSCVGARQPCPSARTRSCLRAARVARRSCACRADEPASATPRPPNAAPRAVAAADCRCRPCHRAPPAAGAGTARRGKRGEREGGAEPRGRVVLRCGEGLAPARAAAAACSHAGCHRWRPRRTLPPLCRSLLTPGSLCVHTVSTRSPARSGMTSSISRSSYSPCLQLFIALLLVD